MSSDAKNIQQLSLFTKSHAAEQSKSSTKSLSHTTWHLFIDGAARQNPGPAGAGIYILKDGVPFYKDGYYLGKLTNNQAEYMALLIGLYFVEQWIQNEDALHIFSDSQLLVRQLQGSYKVRNAGLLPKYNVATQWLKTLHASIQHITREENYHADAMANQGIDLKKPIPPAFDARVRHHAPTHL